MKFLDTKASYWHRKAMQIENDKDHDDYAHYLRLLQQKANFIEFKLQGRRGAIEEAHARAAAGQRSARRVPHCTVVTARKAQARERQTWCDARSLRVTTHGMCLDARDGDVTRPGSPFIPPE